MGSLTNQKTGIPEEVIMVLVRITDLFTFQVYLLCECGNVYQGETCPYCEPEADTAMGVDWADDPTPGYSDKVSHPISPIQIKIAVQAADA
jgi:hypothetical protein